jgi:hypothetical protein
MTVCAIGFSLACLIPGSASAQDEVSIRASATVVSAGPVWALLTSDRELAELYDEKASEAASQRLIAESGAVILSEREPDRGSSGELSNRPSTNFDEGGSPRVRVRVTVAYTAN